MCIRDRDISLENLKDRLGIPADKYKDKNGKDRRDHFEERVLKPAKAGPKRLFGDFLSAQKVTRPQAKLPQSAA